MEELQDFSVSHLSETESELLDADGQRVARIPGNVLEKSFRLKDGTLLIVTSEDCPFEEGFHLSLIKSDGSMLETTHRAIPYSPGIIKELLSVSDDTLKMVLHDGEEIVITVHPEGTRSPFRFIQQRFKSTNGVFGKHYLDVSASQESQQKTGTDLFNFSFMLSSWRKEDTDLLSYAKWSV